MAGTSWAEWDRLPRKGTTEVGHRGRQFCWERHFSEENSLSKGVASSGVLGARTLVCLE